MFITNIDWGKILARHKFNRDNLRHALFNSRLIILFNFHLISNFFNVGKLIQIKLNG